MKIAILLLAIVVSFLCGVGGALLVFCPEFDLLSERVNKEVTLQSPMTVVNTTGNTFRIPPGVNLLYKSRYGGVSTLQLIITTENTSMLRTADQAGLHQYFLKEEHAR